MLASFEAIRSVCSAASARNGANELREVSATAAPAPVPAARSLCHLGEPPGAGRSPADLQGEPGDELPAQRPTTWMKPLPRSGRAGSASARSATTGRAESPGLCARFQVRAAITMPE